jgi:hypothetical protein
MREVRSSVFISALAALSLGLVACGGDSKKAEGEPGSEAKAACTGSPLSGAPKLPSNWPDMGEVTLTQQSTQGPTEIVEGYFDGDITAAHDDFKRELENAGFTILFDELEDHDSEVSWKGQGRSGQVGLREECGATDKIYVHITNRPA